MTAVHAPPKLIYTHVRITGLARVPSLARQPRQVIPLPGGLTNRNFKVTTPDGVFVARLFADGGQLLAIDRDHEYRNSLIAAAAGVGAPVIEYRPADRVLVLGFLDGRTLTNADVAKPATLDRIACRALHAARRFVCDFDMFEVHARYYATAAAARIALPPGYDALQSARHRRQTPPPARRSPSGTRAPCRAITTCSPRTSSTTASGSG
ncbi:MAG: phosphotransferase [Streptosporangiaceae bacterium]